MSHEEEAKQKAEEQRKKLDNVIEKEVELAKAHDQLEEEMKESVNLNKEDDEKSGSGDASIGSAILG